MQKKTIVFQSILSEIGLEGNDQADELAKNGTLVQQSHDGELTFHSLTSKIKHTIHRSFLNATQNKEKDKK